MKIEHIDTTQIDLGLEMGTNIVNFRSVSVWWYLLYYCIKQHLTNIWSSIHETFKQHWGWVEKKRVIIFSNGSLIWDWIIPELCHLHSFFISPNIWYQIMIFLAITSVSTKSDFYKATSRNFTLCLFNTRLNYTQNNKFTAFVARNFLNIKKQLFWKLSVSKFNQNFI